MLNSHPFSFLVAVNIVMYCVCVVVVVVVLFCWFVVRCFFVVSLVTIFVLGWGFFVVCFVLFCFFGWLFVWYFFVGFTFLRGLGWYFLGGMSINHGNVFLRVRVGVLLFVVEKVFVMLITHG